MDQTAFCTLKLRSSVTRLGYFLMLTATHFHKKVANIFGDFLGLLENGTT